jgi:hypothetical protein
MRRLFLVALLGLAGCQGVVGPLQRRGINDPIDHPCLTTDEQARRARDRLPFPDTSPATGPPTGAEEPVRGR